MPMNNMMKYKNLLLEKAEKYILPILLGAAVAYDVIECYYYERAWVFTMLFVIAEAVLFIVFDWLKSKKYIGALVYTVVFVAVMFFASFMLRAGSQYSNIFFVDWFYLDRNNTGFVLEYFYALFAGGGFFLISVIYYFTQVRYRSLGSMLCVLFPFVIHAKRAEPMTDLQVAVLITLFLAVMVHNRQLAMKDKNVKVVMNLSYVISIALFVSFCGAVAMVVPKPEVQSRLERDATAFDLDAADTDDALADYSRLSDVSSPRYGGSFTGQILFYFESDYKAPVYYLRRQAFDEFSNERWRINRNSDKYSDYSYFTSSPIGGKDIYEALRTLAETGKYKEYGLTADKFDQENSVLKSKFRVFDDDFSATYIAAPLGAVSDGFRDANRTNIFMNSDGEIYLYNQDRTYDYTMDYYPQTDDFVSYAQGLEISGEDYSSLIRAAYLNDDLPDLSLLEDYQNAVEYNTGGIEYSERLEALALEITSGCSTDFEKAQALCDYFEDNDYIYDLEYVPDDTSIDYFVFESKTGSCTSYATAMTLMARICGLPSRYVEGFAAYEYTDSGTIAVRDAHAHAFVEVYIPGAGWITFDPTVPGYMVDYSNQSNFSFAVFAQYFSRILIFLGVVFFIVFIVLLDRIIELFFRIRLRFTKGSGRIILLYRHIIRLLEYSSKDDLSAYTPDMIIKYADEKRQVSLEPAARLFEKTCFGGQEMSDAEFQTVYIQYKSAYRYLRKTPKEKAKQ